MADMVTDYMTWLDGQVSRIFFCYYETTIVSAAIDDGSNVTVTGTEGCGAIAIAMLEACGDH